MSGATYIHIHLEQYHMRTNEEWIQSLTGTKQQDALDDLNQILVRGITIALSGRYEIEQTRIESCVQSALASIVANLDSFTGKSRFTTWAQKMAVHATLTELRSGY